MQISSRFTMAIHMLICMENFQDTHKITSEFLASSINSNPVVIRRILQLLKKNNIVQIARGSGGASLARPAKDITLLDVFNSLECFEDNKLFNFHENSNTLCPVGRNIHLILDSRLESIQKTMEDEMKNTTIADILEDTRKILNNN